jgi:phage shock protein C
MKSHHRGLYRSSNQQVIGGVAAGIAEHLNTDPTLIRIIFAIVALFGGGGVLIYIILWIALPTHETTHFEMPKDPIMENKKKAVDSNNPDFGKPMVPTNGGLIAGLIMITLGLIFLADSFLPRIHFGDLWPLILLVVGIVLIKSGYSKPKSKNDETQ